MPPIRSTISKRHTLLATSISLNREIISPYSYYTRKRLVYVIITNPFSRQLSFYAECTKSNTYTSCNMRLVSLNKCIFPAYSASL